MHFLFLIIVPFEATAECCERYAKQTQKAGKERQKLHKTFYLKMAHYNTFDCSTALILKCVTAVAAGVRQNTFKILNHPMLFNVLKAVKYCNNSTYYHNHDK